MSVCEVPVINHGDLVLSDDELRLEIKCYDGYYNADDNSVFLCDAGNRTWNAVIPHCQLLPGLSSTSIMLLIAGPIIIFFMLCFLGDFYFYKRRKQDMREQQGMTYYRELRRVGMFRVSFGTSLEEPDAKPPKQIGSIRRQMLRFKSLIGMMSLKRKTVTPRLEETVEEPSLSDTDSVSASSALTSTNVNNTVTSLESLDTHPQIIKVSSSTTKTKPGQHKENLSLLQTEAEINPEKEPSQNDCDTERKLNGASIGSNWRSRGGNLVNLQLKPSKKLRFLHKQELLPPFPENGEIGKGCVLRSPLPLISHVTLMEEKGQGREIQAWSHSAFPHPV